jgi:hypothetical protein
VSGNPNSPTGARITLWRTFAVYSASRLGLFVAFVALAYLAGLRGLVVAVVALLASAVVSYFLLSRQRAAFALALENRAASRRARTSARTAREDAIADEMARQQQQSSGEVG